MVYNAVINIVITGVVVEWFYNFIKEGDLRPPTRFAENKGK